MSNDAANDTDLRISRLDVYDFIKTQSGNMANWNELSIIDADTKVTFECINDHPRAAGTYRWVVYSHGTDWMKDDKAIHAIKVRALEYVYQFNDERIPYVCEVKAEPIAPPPPPTKLRRTIEADVKAEALKAELEETKRKHKSIECLLVAIYKTAQLYKDPQLACNQICADIDTHWLA